MFIEGVATALQTVGWYFSGVFMGGPQVWQYAVYALVVVFKLGAGLYLFFGGKWIADKAIAGNRPYCLECGYDLTGATGNRCTEWNTPFKPGDVKVSAPASPSDDGE